MAPPRTMLRQTDDTVSLGLQQFLRTERAYVQTLQALDADVARRWRFCRNQNPEIQYPALARFLAYTRELAAFHALYADKLQQLLSDSSTSLSQIEAVVSDLVLVTRVVYAPLHVHRADFKAAFDSQSRAKNTDASAAILREFLATHKLSASQLAAFPVKHLHEVLERVDIILGSTTMTQLCDATKTFLSTSEREAADEAKLVELQSTLRGSPLEMELAGRQLLCHTQVTLSRTSSADTGLVITDTVQPVHDVYCLDDGTVLFLETPAAAAPVGLCINLKNDAVFLETVPRSVGDASHPAAVVLVGPSSSLLVSCKPEASVTDFYAFVDCITTLLTYNDSRTQQLKRGRSAADLDVPDDLKDLLASPEPPLIAFPSFHDDALPGMFWLHNAASDAWTFVELVQCGSWMLIFAVSGWRRHQLIHRIDLASTNTSISDAPRSHDNWGLLITTEPESKGIEVVSERRARIDFWFDQVTKAIEAAIAEKKKREEQAAKAAKAAAEAEAQAKAAAEAEVRAAQAVAEAEAHPKASNAKELPETGEDDSAGSFINVRTKKRQRSTTPVSKAPEASGLDAAEQPDNSSPVVEAKPSSGKKRRSAKASSVEDAVEAAKQALEEDASETHKPTEPDATPTPKSSTKRQRTTPVKTPKQRWVRRKTDDPDDAELESTQPAEGASDEPASEPPVVEDPVPANSIRIIFTGIEPTPKTFKKINSIPGAVYEENIEHATHVIAPKNTLKRTVKLLCGISACDHILDERWLDESAGVHTAVYERQYCLKDTKAEAKWGFDLVKTMYDTPKDVRRRLFDGRRFYITPHKTILPPVQDLVKIVEQAGGEVVTSGAPQDRDLVITSEAAMATAAVAKVVGKCECVYSPELILSSILQQRLDTSQHRLDRATSKTPPRSRGSRS